MTKGGPWGSSSVLAYKMYEEALLVTEWDMVLQLQQYYL